MSVSMVFISLCSSSEKLAAVFLASRIFFVYSEVRSHSALIAIATAASTERISPKGLAFTTVLSMRMACVAAPTPCVKAITAMRPRIIAVRYATIAALPTATTAFHATVAVLTSTIHP